MADTRRRALQVLGERVAAAEALIDAIGALRGTLDRFEWVDSGWYSRRTKAIDTSMLKLSLVQEFGAVSSAARKLGGRRILRLTTEVEAARIPVLAVLDPPIDTGAREAGQTLAQLLQAMVSQASKMAQRKRWLEATVLTAFIVGAAAGFLLGLLVGSAR